MKQTYLLIVEAAHDGQADVFSGVRWKQSDDQADAFSSAQIHDLADIGRQISRHGSHPTQISK